MIENKETPSSHSEEPETKSNYSNPSQELDSSRSDGEMIEVKPVVHEVKEDDEDFALDMINKPPPINRNKKPKGLQFF